MQLVTTTHKSPAVRSLHFRLIILCLCAFALPLQANDSSALYFLSVRSGLELGVDSRDFFREYQRVTSMTISSFEPPLFFAAAMKFGSDEWNIGCTAEMWGLHIGEAAPQRLVLGTQSINRQLVENISLNAIPLYLSAEYTPYRQQFRSYVGAGVGAAIISTKWTEMSEVSVLSDTRLGGIYINEKALRPLARIYCGVFLGFDRFSIGANGGLFLEAGYTWCPNPVKPWTQLSETEKFISGITNSENNFGVTSLNLALGIQFRFERKGK